MTDPRPAVYSRMCGTCVFRPGNPMHLRPGRLRDLVDANLETGTLLICHTTTYDQRAQEVACRGFFDAYGDRVNVVRVMDRLGALSGYESGFQEVEPLTARDPWLGHRDLCPLQWGEDCDCPNGPEYLAEQRPDDDPWIPTWDGRDCGGQPHE